MTDSHKVRSHCDRTAIAPRSVSAADTTTLRVVSIRSTPLDTNRRTSIAPPRPQHTPAIPYPSTPCSDRARKRQADGDEQRDGRHRTAVTTMDVPTARERERE
jgi:hypothetical protein